MEKLLALLAKGHFDYAEDQGDEQIDLVFTQDDSDIPASGFTATVELDALKDLELKHRDGTPVSFADIYADNNRDEFGNVLEDEDEDEVDEDEENA